jgi:hypothetical protein
VHLDLSENKFQSTVSTSPELRAMRSPHRPHTAPNWRKLFTLKPLAVVHAEERSHVLERNLGLWDLVAIGEHFKQYSVDVHMSIQ